MKIVVIGGSGLIGSNFVRKLGEHNHQVVSASPDSETNTIVKKPTKPFTRPP